MNGGEAYPPPSLAGLRAAISSGRYSIALAIAGFVALVIYYFRFIGHPDGMIVYPGAASCLMRGEPLVTCSAGFTYPPFFAFVMIPFTFLPLWGRNLAWYVVLVTAAIGSFKICEALIVKAFHIRQDEDWIDRHVHREFAMFVNSSKELDALVILVDPHRDIRLHIRHVKNQMVLSNHEAGK